MNTQQDQQAASTDALAASMPRQPLDAASRASAEWCFPEIQHAFEKVAQELEDYAAGNPREQALFERAATHLHQGLGALRVMSPAGIDVFADTLERVFSGSSDKPIEWTSEQVQQTRRALMALTEYLEDLIDGLPEEPLLLFPHFKAMQMLSGQARLHPAELFLVPQEAKLLPDSLEPRVLGDEEKARLRMEYEAGLLKTLRAGVNAALASELGTVLEKVAQSPEGLVHYSFWRAAAAVFQAVAESSLEVDLYVKRLVARLNAQLKETLAGGRTINEALYREVLFSLAMARQCSPNVELVRTAFALEGSIPEDFEQSRFGLYDADAERRASAAIPSIKEAWDLVSQKKPGAIQQYIETVDEFHSAASLLGPALSDLSTTWVQVGRAVEGRPAALTDALAVEMATSVLFAEGLFSARLKRATELTRRCTEMVDRLQAAYSGKAVPDMPDWLARLSREAQERSTMSVFIHEAKAGVRMAEEGVDLYLRELKDKSRLGEASASLAQIAGALMLLDQEVPSQAARHLSQSVALLKDANLPPDKDEQERLASSMGALALFVDGLAQNQDQSFDFDPETGAFVLIEEDGEDDHDVVEVVLGTSLTDKKKRRRLLKKASEDAAGTLATPLSAAESVTAPASGLTEEGLTLPDLTASAASSESASTLAEESAAPQADPPVPVLAASSASAAPAALSDDDRELREIFEMEALEVLEAIDQAVQGLAAAPDDDSHMAVVRRGFHTLKGSSRMVQLNDFGEAAWAMEQLLNQYLADSTPANPDFMALVSHARQQFADWISALQADPFHPIDPSALIAQAQAVRDGKPFEAAAPVVVADAPTQTVPAAQALDEPSAPASAEAVLPGLTEPQVMLPEILEPLSVLPEAVPPAPHDHEEALVEPMLPEAVLPEAVLAEMLPPQAELPASLASEADWTDPVPLASAQEMSLSDWLQEQQEAPQAAEETPAAAAAWSEEPALALPEIDEDGRESPPLPAFQADVVSGDAVQGDVVLGDRVIGRALFNIFIEEAQGILVRLEEDLSDWRLNSRSASEVAVRSVHSLKGSSCLVGLMQVHRIAERLEQFMLVTQREGLPALHEEVVQYDAALQGIRDAISSFSMEQEPADQPEALALAQALCEACAQRGSHRVEAPLPAADVSLPEAIAAAAESVAQAPDLTPERPASAATAVAAAAPAGRLAAELAEQRLEQLDEDLLSLFVEEARDYLPQIGENLRAIADKPQDKALQQLAMRQLHTVKGAARMAGAMVLGNRVHDMETRIESAMILSQVPAPVVASLIDDYDDVVQLFEAMQVQGFEAPVPVATALDQALDEELLAVSQEPETAADAAALPAAQADAALPPSDPAIPPSALAATATAGLASAADLPMHAVAPTAPSASAAADAPISSGASLAPAAPVAPLAPTIAAPAAATQTNIRVRADLLDRVVNEAGEVAIVRSRTENAMGSLRTSIGDLTENVGRLRAQLREIEIQAEVQMQAQIAHARESHNFDPLEYDRYTRFQELTRMLAESVNDVATVQQNVNRTIERAGLDLNRQGQLMRELQQNLMRMRMVAFGSISERLYRVVRQTAKELGKRVNLDIRGSATEMDRNVLERMAAPIEHLLRNAIAHGVESPAERAAAGKTETGELTMNVRQDGNEVVLSFRDDGAGLNLQRIRAKAIERGLISEYDELPDNALAELIFMPGFSTADAVNQIAGRGVGMDVVRTEVQSLGGRIDTQSALGKGTEFSVYLPLTLAVTQVVLVKVGEHRFAIPSGSVEQVLQLKAQPLVAAYETQSVQWQNQKVPMQYFGSLLDLSDASPVAQHYSPVLIARTGHHRVAVHVDQVLGNEEVVVKNVGQQVARVPGIAGATVLGDGEIVLIVNPVALAQRQDRSMAIQVMGDFGTSARARSLIDTPPSVLVVDDSLTVRKVTQRLLAREGYDVILAKDGVDALKQLQERVPDVVLSDIEMPRMDGFDLVRNIRGDARLAHLPVVMISSRTADKHQNYAKSLGVNAFLGKPYSEETLLGLLKDYTGDHRARKQAALI